MSVFQGDFLGFTFDNTHSSTLGITRVSDGSRYTEGLLPTIQDKTAAMVGTDGSIYFGSTYGQKQFTIQIAFDALTDLQIRNIKRLFGDKGIHTLIFDEMPYKVYKVKATGTPQLKYVSFSDYSENSYSGSSSSSNPSNANYHHLYKQFSPIESNRIYKGEGTLNFVAYSPFARSKDKFLINYSNSNIDEWKASSGMRISSTKNSSNETDGYTVDTPNYTSHSIDIYNPGDFPTDFILKIKTGAMGQFSLDGNNGSLTLDTFTLDSSAGDTGYQINSALNLIQGINSSGNVTGTIYNRYIIAGNFFKIPVITGTPLQLNFPVGVTSNKAQIIYDYLYY